LQLWALVRFFEKNQQACSFFIESWQPLPIAGLSGLEAAVPQVLFSSVHGKHLIDTYSELASPSQFVREGHFVIHRQRAKY